MREPRAILLTSLLGLILGAGVRPCRAQITLADDIILAVQGKESASRQRESALGRVPGTAASPYRRSPGSTDIILGVDPTRRLAPLPRLTRRPAEPGALRLPGQEPAEREHGLAPAIEPLRLPEALPRGGAEPFGSPAASPEDLGLAEGPPGGLTLDEAIERLVRTGRELRTKFLEIPQAEADILTAGLRENPLVFYSSDTIPYGAYSPRRPGEIEHGLSLVFPVDFSGKRRARVALGQAEKRVLEAQYQNAVRLAIDDLYTAYVDVLAARQAVQAAERSLGLIDQLLRAGRARSPRTAQDEEDLDDLILERELAAMSVGDERDRYRKARQRLGLLLDLTPEQSDALVLGGSIRVLDPQPPPAETLIYVALRHRPDLAAYRLGVERARAELVQEKAERFSDAYLLYTPFEYRDNGPVGRQSATMWGAGIFVSVPLFNRNQGNLRRARLNIDQSRDELASLERQVIAEVRQAARDCENTLGDARRLEQVVLPAVRRKRDRARARLERHELGAAAFLGVQRDTTAIVRYYRETLARHRRNTLRLNTALGLRLLP